MKKNLILILILFLSLPATGFSAATFQEDRIFDGLHAWLPLDGNAEDIGPDAIITIPKSPGGPTPAPGHLGKADRGLHFNGKDDYINLLTDINPSKMPELTVAMWCWPEQKWGVLFGHDNGDWDRGFGFLDLDQYKGLWVNAGPKGKWFGGFHLPQRQWHLVIVTYDVPRGEATLYVKTDKVHAITSQMANPGTGWTFAQIGRSETFKAPFKGRLDDVVIWNRVLEYKEAERLLNHPEVLDNSPRLAAVREMDEAIKLFQAGFFEAGAKRYIAALDRAGAKIPRKNETGPMLEAMKGAPLHIQGAVFLSHYKSLLSREKETKLTFYTADDAKGIRVTNLSKAFPARTDGIRQGDIITQINGRPVRNWAQMAPVLNGISPGATVTLTVLRDNAVRQIPSPTVAGQKNNLATAYGVIRLVDYGMLAAYAGHPALTRAAAMEIASLQKKFPMDVKPFFYRQTAAILTALATAMEQGPDAGYQILLDCGKLDYQTQHHITLFPQYFAPLYANPKKLAYLMDKKESALKKPQPFPARKQAYITPDGKKIGPGAAPALNGSNSKPAAPKAEKAPAAKGTVLD